MTLDEIDELLRDLIGSYTSHPEELLIDRKEHSGSVYWGVTAHGNDTPALVGKQGTHVKALSRILAEIGDAEGEIFIFSLREPKIPRTRDGFQRVEAPRGYDPTKARQLLERILRAAGLEDTQIESILSPAPKYEPPSVIFRIFTRSEDDYGALVGRDEESTVIDQPSLVGAIGTLFRAYATNEGLKFNIEVQRT